MNLTTSEKESSADWFYQFSTLDDQKHVWLRSSMADCIPYFFSRRIPASVVLFILSFLPPCFTKDDKNLLFFQRTSEAQQEEEEVSNEGDNEGDTAGESSDSC
jgi:hypothetical protein